MRLRPLILWLFLVTLGFGPVVQAAPNCAQVIEGAFMDTSKWEFDAATEARLAGIWSSPHLTEVEKMRTYYDAFVEERIKRMGPISRAFASAAARDATHQKGMYARIFNPTLSKLIGPHYNPLANRISMPQKVSFQIVDLMTAFHEMDHAIARNANPSMTIAFLLAFPKELWLAFPTPVTPVARLNMETTAVGSQWEFLSRIPIAHRQRWLDILATEAKAADFTDRLEVMRKSGVLARLYENELPRLSRQYGQKKALDMLEEQILVGLFDTQGAKGALVEVPGAAAAREDPRGLVQFYKRIQGAAKRLEKSSQLAETLYAITVESLQRSVLSKEQFIKLQAESQGYSLQQLFKRHYAGGWRKYLIIQAAIIGLSATFSTDPLEYTENITARDIKAYIRWLVAIFGDEDSVKPERTR